MPWRDREGRLSPLKLAVFLALFAPGLWTAWDWLSGALDPEPLKAALKAVGQYTLYLLLLSLLVTPARQVLRLARLAALRRMLGVGAMAYGLIHFTLYAAHQNWNPLSVVSEIALRFYLTIGFAALIGLVALGATSTDGMIRRMGGAAWRRLHWFAYPIGFLGVLHFILHAKLNVAGPMTMAGLYLWLMGYRALAPQGGAPGPLVLLALAIGAGAATAAMEFAWYGLATGINPWRVLAANLDPDLAPRPALWVLGAGLAAVAARLWRPRHSPRRIAAPAAAE